MSEPNTDHIKKSDPSEREKWERELLLKEREVGIKECELELKKQEQFASGWKNPLVVAIMAAAVAALGNAAVTMTNGKLQRQLEDQKSEQLRIQEMIKTGDPDKAAENLKFLLDAGLISNPEIVPKLRDFLAKRKPGSGPTLPSVSGLDENSMASRIAGLKKREGTKPTVTDQMFTIENHVLLDASGKPVSVVEAKSKGDRLKKVSAIVLHFTATNSSSGLFKYIAEAQVNSSTHLVIDRDGKVTQTVPFDVKAWHAGQSRWNGLENLNQYSIGIDFVNAGQLKKTDGKWKSWDGKTYDDSDVNIEKNATTGQEVGWEKYPESQIKIAEQVVLALGKAYPTIEAVLAHSEIALPPGRKNDPGPALPIERLRAALVKSHGNRSN